MKQTIKGGCRCGAIRYEVDEVFDVICCYCTYCRPLTVWASVRGDAFRTTSGTSRVYETSRTGKNHFCDQCGSCICWEGNHPSHLLARNGRYYSVNVSTLDDPEGCPPQIQQFIERKLSWLKTLDDLPGVAGNSLPHPDSRKLRS